MSDVNARIQKLISENPVVLFMKGTPQFPQCGFSGRVVQILDYLGAPVVGVNVLEDAEIRDGVKQFTNWPTIPQLYVKGEFIGGADIATEMFQSGELAALLTDAGVAVKTPAGELRGGQPLAVDLRECIGAIRISGDLERVGDLAKNIARRAVKLSGEPRLPRAMIGLRHMGELAALLTDAGVAVKTPAKA